MAGRMPGARSTNIPSPQMEQHDPMMRLAKEVGKNALSACGNIVAIVADMVQRGPDGIGMLSFMGGVFTIILGFFGLIAVLDAIISPLSYVLNAYQVAFGVFTCVIEAPLDWVKRNQILFKAKGFIDEMAKFLTTHGGRGLFYIFQGTLSMGLARMTPCLTFFLALYQLFIGLLNIGQQYGYAPDLSCLSNRVKASAEKVTAKQQGDGYIAINP